MTTAQKEKLVDLVEADPATAFGRFQSVEGVAKKRQFWVHVTDVCNSLENDQHHKNVDNWMKVRPHQNKCYY